MSSETTELNPSHEAQVAEFVSQVEAYDQRFRPDTVVDQNGFEREVFHLGDEGIDVTFRGREELPELPLQSDHSRVTAVTDQDERPLHTSGDDYGAWIQNLTKGAKDPFEQAAEEGAESVLFVASSTPRGLVSTAIELAKSGVVPGERLSQLEDLLGTLKSGETTDEVLALYDAMYAATAIKTKDGQVAFNGNDTKPTEKGLMEVVMALAGDKEAAKVIAQKQKIVAKISEQYMRMEMESLPEDTKPKQPGEQLSKDELDLIASKHLVAVHTSPAEPYHIDGSSAGISVIRPTSEFNKGTPEEFPRNTMHWSLNHPVESHVQGGFSDRPFTIIAPLEELAAINGAPAVLYGVDTYFATNPGEGLMVSEKASIVEVRSDPKAPLVEVDGNTVRLREGEISSQDFAEAVGYLSDQFHDVLSNDSEPSDMAEFRLLDMLAASESSTAVFPEKSFQQDDLSRKSEAHQEWLQQALPYNALVEPYFKGGQRPQHKNEFIDAAREALRDAMSNPGTLEKSPAMAPLLTEMLRTTIVKLLIQKQGGRIVTSDGMSAYINDENFSDDVQEVCETVGLRTGLHSYQPESNFEQAYSEALGDATKGMDVPDDLAREAGSTSIPKDFHWEDYDSSHLWDVLISAPATTRRMAMAQGIMTYASKRRVTSDDQY